VRNKSKSSCSIARSGRTTDNARLGPDTADTRISQTTWMHPPGITNDFEHSNPFSTMEYQNDSQTLPMNSKEREKPTAASYPQTSLMESRLFNPEFNLSGKPDIKPLPSTIICQNRKLGISRLAEFTPENPTPVIDKTSLVIKIDGACRGNGGPSPKCAFGVYFGDGSRHNLKGVGVPGHMLPTKNSAELHATVQGIDAVSRILKRYNKVKKVIVITDSTLVSKGMSTWYVQLGSCDIPHSANVSSWTIFRERADPRSIHIWAITDSLFLLGFGDG
jgi:ribonuclease HI